MLIQPNRRRFLFGAGALIAAPSIVRVSSLMPVSVLYGGPAGGEMAEFPETYPSGWTLKIEVSEDGTNWREVVPARLKPRTSGEVVIEIGSSFTPTANTRFRTAIQTPFFSLPK